MLVRCLSFGTLEVDWFLLFGRLFTGVEKRVPSTRHSQSAHHSIDALPSLIFWSLSSRHPMQTMPPSGLSIDETLGR